VLVSYAGRAYGLRPGESVLEGLARHGVSVPAACRAGACHACLLRAEAGDPGAAGQRGLRPSLAARGYFLACLTRPDTDLTVGSGPGASTPARLVARDWLGPGVLGIWVRPRRPLRFLAGQHVTLDRGDGVIRAYSIANLPQEAARHGLEFHVRTHPGGAMSEWLAGAAPGARLRIGAPAGECCYPAGARDAALLLAGTGTGIAPLAAVARDALAHGHAGPVVLIQGASTHGRLYLTARDLNAHDTSAPGTGLPPRTGDRGGTATVRWRTCVRAAGQDIVTAVTAELAALGDPAGIRAFLCGGPGSVVAMRRALFLAGMSLRHICADEFLPAARGSAGPAPR
jgi:CDP-4-dehydro-6-deoxyglucose reductase, E3